MIFFDLDGTLLDFKGSEYIGVIAFYKEYGHNITDNEHQFYENWSQISQKHYKRYLDGELSFEQQKTERVKEIFALGQITLSDKAAHDYFQLYLKHFEESFKPYDDVIPCLKKLSSRQLGIITNGDESQQTLKLKNMGIIDFFDLVVTSGELGIAKPDKRIFETACNKANKKPRECYYIGDDLHTDILPCQTVNMNGIWLDRSRRKDTINGVKVIHSLHELSNLFE